MKSVEPDQFSVRVTIALHFIIFMMFYTALVMVPLEMIKYKQEYYHIGVAQVVAVLFLGLGHLAGIYSATLTKITKRPIWLVSASLVLGLVSSFTIIRYGVDSRVSNARLTVGLCTASFGFTLGLVGTR